MFGSHLSIAGGLENALLEARSFGMDCVQVFTKNQRQWSCKPLTEEQIERWRNAWTQTGVKQVVCHDSYLINLASPKPQTWEKSRSLFEQELRRCDALGISFLVTHPGAHLGEGEEAGMARYVQTLDQTVDDWLAHRRADAPEPGLVVCLETTAGQGTTLGRSFGQLQRMIETSRHSRRLGVCIDTAHLLAAGYDLTGRAGMRRVIAELNETIGLKRVRVAHLNDSKVPQGARKDRHEHIGHGHVAMDAFRELVNHPHFAQTPKILETAKGEAPDGRAWDAVNLEVLQSLVKRKK